MGSAGPLFCDLKRSVQPLVEIVAMLAQGVIRQMHLMAVMFCTIV